MNASLVGVIRRARGSSAVGRVFGSHRGVRGLLRGEILDLTDDEFDLHALRTTPAAALGSNRHRLTEDECDRALDVLRRLEVRFLHVIGGNDSADTGERLARRAAAAAHDLRVVTIPKTVDNDLPHTDHTPGYGSAARFVALATIDAGRDTEAIADVDPVKIVEIVGRDAGWLTLAASLGRREEDDAPHLTYLPERPFSIDRFIADVDASLARRGRAVIALAEAVRDERGAYLQANDSALYTDSFGHRQLGGASAILCDVITARLGVKARADRPGTIQRMLTACQSPVDLAEAERLGTAAVDRAVGGENGTMVTLVREADRPYHCVIGSVPLAEVANRVRTLPIDYLSADGHSPTDAFRGYALPLLGAPLPRHARLSRRFISIPA